MAIQHRRNIKGTFFATRKKRNIYPEDFTRERVLQNHLPERQRISLGKHRDQYENLRAGSEVFGT
jgi:hypothetical protein